MPSYTPTSPYTTSYTFQNVVNGDLSFSSIISTEVDYGGFTSFTDTAPNPPSAIANGSLLGFGWGGFRAGVFGANSSTTFTISYNVDVTNPGEAITSLQQLYVVDDNNGSGTSATAVEQAYNSMGVLVGTTTWSAAAGPSSAVTLATGYQELHIVLTVNESISAAGTSASQIDISTIDQYFGQSPVTATPAVSIVKTVTSVGGVAGDGPATYAGEEIDYSVVVTNTGNETLTNVVVTDPTLGITLGTLASLAVGATASYTASTTVTQAEIDAGGAVPNTAVVTDTQTTSMSSSVSTPVTQTPGVSIVKTVTSVGGAAGDPAATYAGEEIDYSVVVTNTGNETLTNVVVTDPTLGITLGTLASLAVGATASYTASTTVTQAEIDAGGAVPNTAVVTDTQTTSMSSSVSTPVTQTPGVSIVKTVTSVGGAAGDPAATYAGEEIDYSVVVTNTGNETLTNVVVTDPTLGITLGTLASLAVGATASYTASTTVTQAEIDAGGAVPNTAVVTDTQTTSMSSSVSTPVTQTPGVSIVKTVTSVGGAAGDPAATYAGEEIDYSVVVTNTGNETLTNVVVTDPTLGITLGTLASLAVGATASYTASTTVTQAEIDAGGAVPNTAVVTDTQTTSMSSSVSTPVTQTPGVSIVKTVTSVGGTAGDPAATYAGEAIDYSVVVTNTGNETLTNVVVTDPTLGITLGTLASLAVGATASYTASTTVTQAEIDAGGAVPNTAVVTDTQTTSMSSSVSTPVTQTPGVSIVKTVTSVGGAAGDPAATYAGEEIDYSVVVTNTGNETLTNVVVTDPTLGITLGTLASLAVGATASYTASTTVTQAEIDAGGAVPNTAVVTDTQTTSMSSSVSTPVTQTPGVSIVKTVTSVGGAAGDPAATYAGEEIDYSVVVTNTGNETLTNVVVTDPTLGITLGTLASLAVGATASYTASTTVTQAEIDAGGAVPNTAVVTDTQTTSMSSSVSTPVTQTPGVSIVKTVTSVGGAAGDPAATYAGEEIDYSVVVTNTGNETLTNVVVTDPTLGITLGTLASLAVGATASYTASTTVTQAEINSGGAIPNTAVVTDTQTTSMSSSVSTPVTQTPGVSIVKTVTSVGGAAGDPAATYSGEAIDYSVVVTNTGNETLTNVVVTDPTLGITLGTLASLAPGATASYTASTTVTQAEINSGGAIPNTAVVTDTQTTSKSSSVSTPVTQTPGVSIVKTVTSVGGTAGDPAATYAGEAIDYSVVVTNTGNETLTNVVVTDPTLGITLGTLASLAPGATASYTASTTVTQAEINSGGAIPNTAVVTDTQTTSKSSSVSTPVTQTPGVSIVKTVTSVGGTAGDPAATYAGEAIDYSVVVTNTGNETLTNVVVTDPTLGITLGTVASLAPGATASYTASTTVTQAEINSGGAIPNTAVVTDTQTTLMSSSVSTPVTQTPGVSIVKTVTLVGGTAGDPAATYAGEAIDYSVVVTNTGNETLTNVVVTDPTLGITLGTLASLAPGATASYTASTTVTQAEINGGGAIPNTAVVTDTQTTSKSSSVSTPVTQTPGVSIVKTVTSVGGAAGDPAATYAGEAIDYSVVVTNTGNETLTNVVVTDPTLGITLGTLASLAVGATASYTASTTVTQAEINSGGAIPNTAVVTDTQTTSKSSSVSTPVTQLPGVSIVKTVTSVGGVSGDPTANTAGEVIDYKIVVTNTGNETLTNVVITDPTIGTTLGTLTSLTVGASATYTASLTVTQAEINSGNPITNTAVVTDTQTPSMSSTASTAVTLIPGISIVKTVTSVGGVAGDGPATYAGEVIDYKIVVTNTGNEALTGVTVTDPLTGATLATGTTLAVGASATYTTSYTVTQAEIDDNGITPGTQIYVSNMSLANGYEMVTFTGSSSWSGGTEYTGQQDLTVNYGDTDNTSAQFNVYAWCVDVFDDINIGSNNITYTLQQLGVTNAGMIGELAAWGNAQLASGPNALVSAAVQADIWMLEYGVGLASSNSSSLINEVAYINNTVLPSLSATSTVELSGTMQGGTTAQTLCAPQGLNGEIVNTAIVTDTQTPSQSSTVSTGVSQVPGVSIVKTVTSVGGVAGDPAATAAGEVIDYKVVVTNTGSETLTNVVVKDPTLGTTLGTLASLAPGASATYTASQTVTQAEINSGAAITNTATVTDNQTPSQSSTASTGVSQVAGVSIVKTVTSVGGVAGDPAATTAGEVIDYKVVVTNTGSKTLTNVVVKDPTLGTTLGTLASLAPGATASYTASQTVTQAEINSGAAITNTATVTDTQTPSQSSTVSTAVSQTPGVSIVKTVTSVGGVAGDPAATTAGEVIDYKVVVTNTGNETLTNVVVTDATLGTTLGTLASLAPGATASYTASQTVTQAEINSGAAVTNVAVVTDTQTSSQSSTVSTAVSQTPGVSIVKTVTSVGGVAGDPTATKLGEVIDYSIVVTNTGNETLTNVVVQDTTLGTTLGTLASLAPGATASYTASTTVTQSELNTGTAATNTATVTDTQNVTGSSTATTPVQEQTGGITGSTGSGISVIKLPSQVVVSTCGEVTYTFDVTNTGSTALTNVQLTDNIGTAANPDYITPVLQTQTTNGVLLPGQTWVYTATINELGDCTTSGGSQSCSLSGQDLGSGCTAWLNSCFAPTSCANGATYTFQDITCTIKGPNCGTITLNVPNACITFSSSCKQPTTVFNASENCWVTTLPANCNPGNVFLSGLPYQILSGCNLSGATVSWSIGESGNNCGSSGVSWQTGCASYSSFDQNGCNGLSDYNQIGVQVCDNLGGCGDGGNQGSSNNCAGTPCNQYTNGNCCSSNGDGTCGNGSGSGSVSCGQLGDNSQADTATVTATSLSSGFSLGDAANYGIIAFSPSVLSAASNSPINGSVGIGKSCGSTTVQLNGDKITGNLVATGTAPSKTGGTVTGSITGNSSTLATDISALQALSLTLASETGTTEKLTSGLTINATSGTLDSAGDYVFNVTQWANNITINGTGSNDVVLNIASGVNVNLDNLTLTGGITADQVLINDQNTGTITSTSGDTFNATVLAPNAVFDVASSVTINGHLFGGASGQTFTFTSGATLNAPADTGTGTPTIATVSASDSTEIQVLTSNSPITENGTAPTGSLASLYGTADKLEFTYNPGDTVSLGAGGLGTASLSIPSSPAFIAITNNSNPSASGAQIYFEGEVQTGEDIFADATINQLTNTAVAAPNNVFSTASGADIYIDIYASQAAFLAGSSPVQTMTYSTASNHSMHLGDEIGSLTLVGYVGSTGGHLVS